MEIKKINLKDILEFEQRYRTTFINSLSGFKTPVLIGTWDGNGKANLAIFNSLIHIGASPPLVGFIVRPDSVERHTLQNILETKVFTINHVKEEFYKKAHQTSARYSNEQNEFKEVGLTEEYKTDFFAPFVKESSIQIGLDFIEKIDITINGTTMVIGKIKTLTIPINCIHTDGFIDVKKAGTIASAGVDSYYKTTPISRLSYAKPNTEITVIKSSTID